MNKQKIILTLLTLCFSIFGFGQCKKGDCENGIGTYIFNDGSKYVGDWLDRRQEGNGIYTYTVPKKKEKGIIYATKYDGEWVNGRHEGNGIMSYHNGTTWTGIFRDGKQLEGCYNNENCYNPEDVVGNKKYITIDLETREEMPDHFVVSVSFGDENQIIEDFLFDTGAGDLKITEKFLKKLKKNKVKITNLPIKDVTFETSAGSASGRYVKIDNITIGEYNVNNVVVAVTQDGSFLFGNGIYKKFSKWSSCQGSEGNYIELHK
jgi:hypothetical protein|tara:strand:+ start:145 stop:933 length:789 start_codon:yes stop_codon:yes gene_type:complete